MPPKRWGDRFSKDQIELGAKKGNLDPCVYMFYDENDALCGVVGVRVDDVRCTGSDRWYETTWPKECELYSWGEWEDMEFKFTGVTYRGERGRWASLDMSHYIQQLKPVETKKLSHLVEPEQGQLERAKRKLNKLGLSVFRGVAGSLQWCATQGRPDVLGNVVEVQKGLSGPTIGQLDLGASTFTTLIN